MKKDMTPILMEHTVVPFTHQTEAFEISKNRKAFALFMEMGTAKTKIIIDTAQYLYNEREIDGLLVTAPKGGYMNWIDNELPRHLPKSIPTRIGWYNADCTVSHERKMYKMMDAKDDYLDIMIMNIEALQTSRGRGFAYKFANQHWTMMAVDESQGIKNPKAIRTKEAIAIGQLCEYRRILSGTPITKYPLDLFSQFEFLHRGLLGFPDFLSFKNYYASYYLHVEGRIRYEVIKDYKNLGELTESIKPHVYRKLKSECLDLPPKLFETRYIQHTEEQRHFYREFKDKAILELSETSILTSTSVLRSMIKLHQINCGHIKDDAGTVTRIKHNRLTELIEILDEVEGKVIIWAGFKEDILAITEELRKRYGTQSTVDYYGDTTDDNRRKNEHRFINDPLCKYFVSTPDTGGRSLTLVVASTTIYYSYRDNLEHWLQSQDRNHRPGQRSAVTYIVFAVRNTVDITIMKSLQSKRDLAAEVLDNWREALDPIENDLNWS